MLGGFPGPDGVNQLRVCEDTFDEGRVEYSLDIGTSRHVFKSAAGALDIYKQLYCALNNIQRRPNKM